MLVARRIAATRAEKLVGFRAAFEHIGRRIACQNVFVSTAAKVLDIGQDITSSVATGVGPRRQIDGHTEERMLVARRVAATRAEKLVGFRAAFEHIGFCIARQRIRVVTSANVLDALENIPPRRPTIVDLGRQVHIDRKG